MKRVFIVIFGCAIIIFIHCTFNPPHNNGELIIATNSTYDKGLDSLLKIIKRKQISIYPDKPRVFYFWDSIDFSLYHRLRIELFDSLAGAFKSKEFNFFIATEMSEQASRNLLRQQNITINNSEIIYEAQDFISGVYNQFDSTLSKSSTGTKYKFKPYYFITDSEGKVRFSGSGRIDTNLDTSIVRILRSLTKSE